jgi:hypothetical protein
MKKERRGNGGNLPVNGAMYCRGFEVMELVWTFS